MTLPKREAPDRPISPPPLKKKLQSSTTKSAISTFFTPTSQKPKDRTKWTERSVKDDTPATLLVGSYVPESHQPGEKPHVRHKVAVFDLDSTLIATASGKKHASDAADWKWWDPKVPVRLRRLYENEGYRVVILSNQGGLTLHPDPKVKGPKANSTTRVNEFKQKCSAILNRLDLPTTIYAATGHDIFRKPRTGMWQEACSDYDIDLGEVDFKQSFFVGDAAGRPAFTSKTSQGSTVVVAKDFSCSDRNFAHNAGIGFKTPEEFFLDEEPRTFNREFDLAQHPFDDGPQQQVADAMKFTAGDGQEIVLFCGPPGAGKSTFFWKFLKPHGYERINQDTLKTRDKCLQVAAEHLKDGKSIAIDNTNADQETRAAWVSLAKKRSLPIRCVLFNTPLYLCEHNNVVRALNSNTHNPETRQLLPKLAFTGFSSRFKAPKLEEGFKQIIEIPFVFRGSKEEYDVWGRYWL